MLFYNLALFLLFLLFLPKLLYQRIFFGKYKSYLRNRLGFDFKELENCRPIWIHAVSVGETKAVAALAKILKEAYPEKKLLITSITETGQKEAMRSIPFADYHLFLPFDLSFIIGPVVKRVAPCLILVSETDLWLNFLTEAKRAGAKVVLVNGKISERSCKRLSFFQFFAKKLLAPIDLFIVQSKRYCDRFLSLGVAPQKIAVSGNLKLDFPIKEAECSPFPEGRYITAGSTHLGEDEIILDAFKKLLPRFQGLKLFLVPRHPERFDQVEALLKTYPFTSERLSNRSTSDPDVLLIDAMGLLNSCYAHSEAAIVCGSFVKGVGGHNIFEPMQFGKPVVFGPYMHNQLDLAEAALDAHACIRTDKDTLAEKIAELLACPQDASKMGNAGRLLFHSMQGATKKTADLIFPLVNKSSES